jgi:hypothetical protein
MNRLKQWLIDRRRGYSDADLESLLAKQAACKPGGLFPVTPAEMRAHIAYMRSLCKKSIFEA